MAAIFIVEIVASINLAIIICEITPTPQPQLMEIPFELLNLAIQTYRVQDSYDPRELETCGIVAFIIP